MKWFTLNICCCRIKCLDINFFAFSPYVNRNTYYLIEIFIKVNTSIFLVYYVLGAFNEINSI